MLPPASLGTATASSAVTAAVAAPAALAAPDAADAAAGSVPLFEGLTASASFTAHGPGLLQSLRDPAKEVVYVPVFLPHKCLHCGRDCETLQGQPNVPHPATPWSSAGHVPGILHWAAPWALPQGQDRTACAPNHPAELASVPANRGDADPTDSCAERVLEALAGEQSAPWPRSGKSPAGLGAGHSANE